LKCNASSLLGRRAFLQLSSLAAAGSCLELASAAERDAGAPHPTHVLRIRKGEVELAQGRCITTTTYNGQLPGPPLRATVGQRVLVDVYNETDTTEQIHWQGQTLADAAASVVPAHGLRRMEFTPRRAGVYLYHSQVVAAANLQAGLYSGQAGALLVEPRSHAGRYDREWVVVLKGCEPFMRRTARGCEVAYSALTVNGRLPGHGTALRARTGERVLLHVLNAGATESYSLELPGHDFEITALDGCPVPAATRVAALHLRPGERVSAYVVVKRPTGWLLRETAHSTSDPRYFGPTALSEPDETRSLVLTRHEAARSGFNRWSVNGVSFSTADPQPAFRVRLGYRYRLKIHNTSDEVVPLHLQRHRLQVVRGDSAGASAVRALAAGLVAAGPADGSRAGGVLRDVVAVGARQQLEVDFVADSPGPALLHCTRQLHSDFGLVALIDYT
jgi:FtsP/CotA-like multicopper oxidase with cupredoxin domain